jgi:hypothetical protein
MRPRPSLAAALAIAGLAVFTAWITWRAKILEAGARAGDQAVALLHKPAPDFSLPALGGHVVSLAACDDGWTVSSSGKLTIPSWF